MQSRSVDRPRHRPPAGIPVAAAALCLVALVAVFAAASARGAREGVIEREAIPARVVVNTSALDTDSAAAFEAEGPAPAELPTTPTAGVADGGVPDSAAPNALPDTATLVEGANLPASIPAEVAPAPAQPATTTAAGGANGLSAPPSPDAGAAGDGGDAEVRCGDTICGPGLLCCNESCGFCSEPGGSCPQYSCSPRALPTSDFCGFATCNVDQVCCNPSCGTCVSPGETCDLTPCSRVPNNPASYMCGMATCNVGMVCCNASCGICTRPGESCSRDICG